ncbi:MAG: hypothetical protein V1732_03935 [Patescibacteria group bacterium]
MVNPIEIIGSLIFFLLAAWLIYQTQIKPRQRIATPESPEKKGYFAGLYGIKGKIGGKIKRPKISIKGFILLVIICFLVVSLVYNGILEVPDKVFSAEELLNYTVSGNCKVQGDEFVCAGPWKIFIPDPDKKTIGKLTVVPGTESLKEITIQAGLYRVDYSQGDLKQFGGTICGYAAKGVYHRAMIYYNGKPKTGNCYPVGVPTGMAPKNLYFGTTWLRLIIPGSEDPQFYVDWDIISRSYINDKQQRYMGGDITISSQQGVRIKSVNVVYSRYRII